MRFDYDLFVIGAGSGGATARLAAAYGVCMAITTASARSKQQLAISTQQLTIS